MSRRGRQVCIVALYGVMTFTMVSVSAGAEEVLETRPKVELSAGTWISVGDTRWAHDASSVAGYGNPTSKLTYKDVGTNVIDLAGKFWLSPTVFGRLNGGFADIGGGRLTDDDYGSGQRLFSRTISNVPDNNMYYINADLGGRVKEFPNHRGYLDLFGGYQYWHTEHQAVGIGQVVCDPGAIPGLPCAPAGTSSNQGETVITNKANWHSIRVGASTEYRLTRRLSLIGTAALIPLSIIENKDIHHLRNDLQKNPSISMLGFGVGADADVGARFMFTKSIGLNVGYRVWWNHAVDGTITAHGVSGSAEYPLVQFDSLRHGLTAGINFTF
jgi:Protochlamydia outer membrane protein